MGTMIEITLSDLGKGAVADIQEALDHYPEAAGKAIGAAFRQGGVAGSKWPKINLAARRMSQANRSFGWVKNWRSKYRGRKGKKWRGREYWSERPPGPARRARDLPFQKFKGALRYRVDDDGLGMEVGFIETSFEFERIIERHAAGFTNPITAKARRFAFAMGLPVSKGKSSFHVPARPLVGPVWRREEGESVRNIEETFYRKLGELI